MSQEEAESHLDPGGPGQVHPSHSTEGKTEALGGMELGGLESPLTAPLMPADGPH